MKALIQRVKKASVKTEGNIIGEIDHGILIFLGVGHEDTEKDSDYLLEKILNLRIFENDGKPMDKSVLDIKGDLLIVSQFTLFGSTKKGRRPDYTDAASPDHARTLYKLFINKCSESGLKTKAGQFGAMMEVSLINDGPVTLMINSR